MRLRCLLVVVALNMLSFYGFAQSSPAQHPGREVSLPPTEVKDTFFAYVLGIIKAGIEVDIDNERMRDILTEFKTALNLPFDLISRVTQHTVAETGERQIGLDFVRNVVIPIPFSLLFYHPGSITADRSLVFQVVRSTYTDPGVPEQPALVFDLVLEQGNILVDIDDWLEVLFSAYLEDTWIRHIVFFTWNGDWIGLLEGNGKRTGRVLRAYFNFTHNKIIFPVPAALDKTGKIFVP
ncbi:MAG: hypothetical protein ABSF77_12715 [Spirochaetia bacterium]